MTSRERSRLGENDQKSAASGAPDEGPVILFDGVCNLCAGVVRFVLAHERIGSGGTGTRAKFRFASLQSEAAKQLLAASRQSAGSLPDSIVLVDHDGLHVRSEAVLRIAAGLNRPFSFLRVLRLIPRPVRDAGYAAVAASRYRLFGRQDVCMAPSAELAARFLPEPGAGGKSPAPAAPIEREHG